MDLKAFKISFNAPVILTLTFFSFLIVILSTYNHYFETKILRYFAIYYTSWEDPLLYPRMLTHILGHQSLAHFINNFMLILVLGPIIEEKYGSKNVLLMILITAFITALIQISVLPHVVLLGASGIVFMLILLASFANVKNGAIPITLLLVAILYLGNESINGVFVQDNISRMAHIIGGGCGAIFGFLYQNDHID